MPFVQAKCPECGGLVEVDNEKRAGLCQHCGQPFVVEDAIQTFNTYYQTTNNYNTTHNYGEGAVVNVYENKENIDNLILRIQQYLTDKNWDKVNEYCEKALDINPKNALIYLYKLMAEIYVSDFKDICGNKSFALYSITIKSCGSHKKEIASFLKKELGLGSGEVLKLCDNLPISIHTHCDYIYTLPWKSDAEIEVNKLSIKRVKDSQNYKKIFEYGDEEFFQRYKIYLMF